MAQRVSVSDFGRALRERFATAHPGIDARIARPGDVFEIADGHIRHTAGTSEIVEMKQDDVRLIEFDPTAPIPSLVDPNPDGYRVAKLEEITHRFIADEMGAFTSGAEATNDPVVRIYRERGVRYAVAVVFPDLVSRSAARQQAVSRSWTAVLR